MEREFEGFHTPKSESSFKIYPRNPPKKPRRSKTIVEANSALFKSLGTLMHKDFFKKEKESFPRVKSNYSKRALLKEPELQKRNTIISESPEITRRHTPFVNPTPDYAASFDHGRLVRPDKVEILTHSFQNSSSPKP